MSNGLAMKISSMTRRSTFPFGQSNTLNLGFVRVPKSCIGKEDGKLAKDIMFGRLPVV